MSTEAVSTDQTTFSGGIENVHAAGNATRTTVNSGGELIVLAGGKADVTTINNSGIVNVIGGTVDLTDDQQWRRILSCRC